MNINYTIGIAAKNEENNIRLMLDSLNKDIASGISGSLETIVCTNDTTDSTEKIVDACILEYPLLNIRRISSSSGKANAQRAIISNQKSAADFIIFYDADITIHPGSTQKFVNHLESNPSTKATTGDQIPYESNNILYKILNIEALHPDLSTPERKYLIGRCIGIRKNDYYIPETVVGEDMFLSNYLVDKYGYDAVKKVPDVLVSYTGPQTLKDYFYKTRRYTLDKEVLYAEYPEFKKLKNLFKRSINHELKNQLSFTDKCYLLAHDIIKYFSVKLASTSSKERWVPLKTTKGVI